MKEPIISRTALYSKVGRSTTLVWLDWTIVETELGTGLEPVSISSINGDDHREIDSHFEGFTKLMQIDDGNLQTLFSTGGRLFFREFSRN